MSGAQSLIIPEVYTVQQALARCIEQLLYVIDLLPDEVYVAQDTPRTPALAVIFVMSSNSCRCLVIKLPTDMAITSFATKSRV